jgi:hypothetical protein
MSKTLFAFAAAACCLAVAFGAEAANKKKPTVSYSEDVAPLLKFRCGECHTGDGSGVQQSGLELSTYQGLMKGTKFGAIVVPGEPLTSNLMVLIDGKADKSLQMPHGKKKLNECDRNTIRTWILEGAQNN